MFGNHISLHTWCKEVMLGNRNDRNDLEEMEWIREQHRDEECDIHQYRQYRMLRNTINDYLCHIVAETKITQRADRRVEDTRDNDAGMQEQGEYMLVPFHARFNGHNLWREMDKDA